MLSFSMVAVVVVDSDSRFIGAFEVMCNFLQITLLYLACINHKVNNVEVYHRFLKKHKLLQDNIIVVMVYLS